MENSVLRNSGQLTFNIAKAQKRAMNEAAKKCALSREQIVDEMNNLAASFGVNLNGSSRQLSVDTLEKWINPSITNRHMPMVALPIFCSVVKDNTPLDILGWPIGCKVIGPYECILLEWAKLKRQVKKDREKLRQLEDYL